MPTDANGFDNYKLLILDSLEKLTASQATNSAIIVDIAKDVAVINNNMSTMTDGLKDHAAEHKKLSARVDELEKYRERWVGKQSVIASIAGAVLAILFDTLVNLKFPS